MDGMEKLIRVMRKEGSRNNPDPLVLGEMTAKDKVSIKGMEFEGDELYIAEHLLDQEIEVSFEGWKTQSKSGGSGYAEFASHNHEIDVSKKKMTVQTPPSPKFHLIFPAPVFGSGSVRNITFST